MRNSERRRTSVTWCRGRAATNGFHVRWNRPSPSSEVGTWWAGGWTGHQCDDVRDRPGSDTQRFRGLPCPCVRRRVCGRRHDRSRTGKRRARRKRRRIRRNRLKALIPAVRRCATSLASEHGAAAGRCRDSASVTRPRETSTQSARRNGSPGHVGWPRDRQSGHHLTTSIPSLHAIDDQDCACACTLPLTIGPSVPIPVVSSGTRVASFTTKRGRSRRLWQRTSSASGRQKRIRG
jgi:hypothetical protein